LFVKTDTRPCAQAEVDEFLADYTVDSELVAEAMLAHIEALADARARFRRSLLYSVEMIETPELEFDLDAIRVD
jgi:hypothetical protein